MMNAKILSLVFLAAASTSVLADAGNPGAAALPAARFQLKNRSAFTAANAAHNPFWPIGWNKGSSAMVAGAASSTMALRADNFEVTAILLNDPPMAVVNGKAMAEGELLPMTIGGQKVAVQLASVQDGQIVIRYQNSNIVVPLRRHGEASLSALRVPNSLR